MARGRRPKVDGSVMRSVRIPTELDETLILLLMNPISGETAYGAFSSLVTRLLREWVEGKRK